MKPFRDYQPDQMYLLPPSHWDWLPDDHLVHFINELTQVLDLSAIYAGYEGRRGQPPYDPEMMTKVWIYAYCLGIRSSRKVEQALHEHIGFRVLSGDQQPGYWTLNNFRSRHSEALGELFFQTVQLAVKLGLVSMKQIAIDGTKLKANASKNKAMSYKRMCEEEKRLKAEIEAYLNECDAVDKEENEKYGDNRGDELPEHLRIPEQRLEAIRKAKAELEAEARERARHEQEERRAKAESEGRAFRPRKDPDKATPKARAQRNFTDPESRIMKGPDAFVQAYNGQLAVDTESQIIVGGDLTNRPNDYLHLPELVHQSIENTGIPPEEVSADAGYFSEENVTFVEATGAEAFIPPDKMPHKVWVKLDPLPEPPPDATKADLMRHTLSTERGRERYKQRQMSVEPVIGQVKSARGLRQVLHRGVKKVRDMWFLDLAAHNLLKIFRSGALDKAVY